MDIRANIFRVGAVPWQIKPCTTQSYGVTDTMNMQMTWIAENKWSRHAEKSKDREHMAPKERKGAGVIHFT